MCIIDIKKQLLLKGMQLPNPVQPVGNYKAVITAGKLAFISGQLPLKNGCVIYKGKLGKELSIEDGKNAAALCALNVLSHVVELQKKYEFKQLVKIEGYINSISTFTKHAMVLDGASDLFSSILLNSSGHARSVLGCSSLPLDAAVEVTAILEIE